MADFADKSFQAPGGRGLAGPAWFFPSIALVLIFGMAARAPVDSDLWWHLRAGEATWETGRPVLQDLFSFTRTGMPWTNHSWLAQVILYGVFHSLGSAGLGALVAGLAAASMGLVYFQLEGHPLLRAFILVFASGVAALVWSPRPQLFSLVMFALLGYLLYLFKWHKRDRLWMIVPLFILWSNLHGGYVLGILLIAGMIAGEILNHLLGFEGPEAIPWRGLVRLFLWGAAGSLAVAINPNGLAMWLVPFRTVGVGVLRDFISEWASPDFHNFIQQPFLWLLLGTLGLAGISRRRLDGSDLILVIGFAYLAFLARRNYGPFALVAAPVLSRHLVSVWKDWRARRAGWLEDWRRATRSINRRFRQDPARFKKLARFQPLLNFAILVILAGAVLVKLSLVTRPGLVDDLNRAAFPVEAVEWIRDHRPPGKLFNEYNWGGYLVWELREYPVFVDGRTDLFDEALLREYLSAVRGEPGWEATFDRYQINLALLETDSGLARELERSEGWLAGYRDEGAVVFIRGPSPTK